MKKEQYFLQAGPQQDFSVWTVPRTQPIFVASGVCWQSNSE